MTEQTNNNVPKIRFKGFEGEWNNTTFQTACSLLTGHPFQSKQFTKSGFFLVRGMNVKRGYVDDSEQISEFWSSSIGLEAFLLKEDDIVIQMDGALIGRSYAKVRQENLPALLVQRVTRARCESTSNSEYIYQYIERDFLKYIRATKTETAVPHLSLNDIRQFPISISTPPEQTKIGGYFRELNQLIGLHQRKHDKLVTLKKAMLQKMFPQPGATTPEIRFKGFSETWVEKRLDEICEIVGGGTPSTSTKEYWGGDIDWYSPTEIGDEVYASGSVKKITLLGLSKSSARLLPPDKTVLFTSRAGIGDMAILTKEGCTNQGFQSMVLNDETDPYFIYSMGHLIKIHALKHASGSTFLEVSSKQLGKMKILLPKEDEQQKIGTYFRTLDELISKHAIQLNKLQQIKSACLEKMFV